MTKTGWKLKTHEDKKTKAQNEILALFDKYLPVLMVANIVFLEGVNDGKNTFVAEVYANLQTETVAALLNAKIEHEGKTYVFRGVGHNKDCLGLFFWEL